MNNNTPEKLIMNSTDISVVVDVTKTKTDSNIKVFENPELGSIRIIEVKGEPWFVGKDVADILGYANPSKALNDHVEEEDKLNNKSLSSLGQRGGWIINESGLYSLILSSKLPKAKEFKHWVTSEVLPSIRKTGAYISKDSEIQQHIDYLQDMVTSLSLKILEMNKSMNLLTAKPTVNMKVVNMWKKHIANKRMEILSSNSGIDIKECYKMVYDVMADDYGFCESAVINDFLNHYECENVSTITIIATDKTYQQWFVQAADKLIDCVTPKSDISINNPKHNIYDNSDKSAINNISDDIKFKTIKLQDDYEDIITYMATIRKDQSKKQLGTRRLIFRKMLSNKGWKNVLTRNKCSLKKDVIISNIKYKKRFVNICNDIIAQMKK